MIVGVLGGPGFSKILIRTSYAGKSFLGQHDALVIRAQTGRWTESVKTPGMKEQAVEAEKDQIIAQIERDGDRANRSPWVLRLAGPTCSR
jgi:hypothetical protein